MKTKFIILIGFVLIAGSLISFSLLSKENGPHDGTVKIAGEYNIEMVKNNSRFYVFLLDKMMKPISNKGITCDAKLVLLDRTNVIVHLIPFWEDAFAIKFDGSQIASCRVNFNISGKIVSAVFGNDNLVVQK